MNHTRLGNLCAFVEVITRKRDPYERGESNHNKNTAMLAEKLARAYGMSEEMAHILKHAACLHDWGKLVIPEHVLNKPGLLSDAEIAMVREHSIFGYQMFISLNFGREINDICLPVIKNHHERWDGTGYPDKLKGDQISIYARIVGIADAYDAMTDHRVYQPIPILNKTALDKMMEQYEKQFDPDLLKLFVQMMTESEK